MSGYRLHPRDQQEQGGAAVGRGSVMGARPPVLTQVWQVRGGWDEGVGRCVLHEPHGEECWGHAPHPIGVTPHWGPLWSLAQ